MSKVDKGAKIDELSGSDVVMLSESDLTISGRGRGREHSTLYVAAAALPAPINGQYAALKTTGNKISATNNTVQALRRDFPDRQYATRNRGAFIVRIS